LLFHVLDQLRDDLLVYLQKLTTAFAYHVLMNRLGIRCGKFIAVDSLAELKPSQKPKLAQQFHGPVHGRLAYSVPLLQELSVDILRTEMSLAGLCKDLQHDLSLGGHSVLSRSQFFSERLVEHALPPFTRS